MFGGRSGSDSFSSTAESLDPASLSWGLYDDLAMPGGSSFFQHCMVKVNDSLAFMAGGYKDGVETYSDEAYLLDLVRRVENGREKQKWCFIYFSPIKKRWDQTMQSEILAVFYK